MRVWLDDERPPPEGWVWVKSGQEAIHNLGSHRGAQERLDFWEHYGLRDFWTITHMSFDHDLADVHYAYWYIGHVDGGSIPRDDPRRVKAREYAAREVTGYDVLLWMAEHNVWPTEACFVHTHNSARANAMCGVINRYGPYDRPVRWTPYQAGSSV